MIRKHLIRKIHGRTKNLDEDIITFLQFSYLAYSDLKSLLAVEQTAANLGRFPVVKLVTYTWQHMPNQSTVISNYRVKILPNSFFLFTLIAFYCTEFDSRKSRPSAIMLGFSRQSGSSSIGKVLTNK